MVPHKKGDGFCLQMLGLICTFRTIIPAKNYVGQIYKCVF